MAMELMAIKLLILKGAPVLLDETEGRLDTGSTAILEL